MDTAAKQWFCIPSTTTSSGFGTKWCAAIETGKTGCSAAIIVQPHIFVAQPSDSSIFETCHGFHWFAHRLDPTTPGIQKSPVR